MSNPVTMYGAPLSQGKQARSFAGGGDFAASFSGTILNERFWHSSRRPQNWVVPRRVKAWATEAGRAALCVRFESNEVSATLGRTPTGALFSLQGFTVEVPVSPKKDIPHY
ncbi:hypothetical protein AVEN_257062-1 [Araneus ventricosus]|uniref:Uncharacterized protein n=1 Tax=Araneus ventricosus TaxID=182803 RepID=A0A4Y2NZY7_ARAVE|nr:hypothetical protein AVEN_257062-1 [Araneus ventricosus]